MVSLETLQDTSKTTIESNSSPRISFSADFLDEKSFISICPNPQVENDAGNERSKFPRNPDFEFLSGNVTNMITADELFYEGKLLPFWQKHYAEKLNKVALKGDNSTVSAEQACPNKSEIAAEPNSKDEPRISWFLDDDPSPRPPKCTVLWKELLRLRKQRSSSTLSPSSSSSSSSSSRSSLGDISSSDEKKEGSTGENKEKATMKRIYKKGLERTRSATIRIRPVINVPICTQQPKNSALPPLFSLKKGRIDREDIDGDESGDGEELEAQLQKLNLYPDD